MDVVLHPLPRVVVLVLLLLGLAGSRDGRSQGHTDHPAVKLTPAVYEPDRTRPSEALGAVRLVAEAEGVGERVSYGSSGEMVAESPVEDHGVVAREDEDDAGDTADELPGVDGSRTMYRICRVTAYCDRGRTAAGVRSGVGQCAAPGYVPLGSLVRVPDLNRTFLVTDRTDKRFRNSTVDLFIPSERQCKKFGRKYLEVEIVVPPAEQRARNLGYRG